MGEREVLLSSHEYERLKDELEFLTNERRREVAERIRKARGFGDLSENAEYDAAKEEQALLESQIARRRDLLKRAQVVRPEDVDSDRVNVGCAVTIVDESTGEEFTYIIVGAAHADPSRKRISYRSPVGEALYECKVGDSVRVNLPGGLVTYRIEEIKWVGGEADEAAAEEGQG